MKKAYVALMSLLLLAGFALLNTVSLFAPKTSLNTTYIPREEFSLYFTVEQENVKYNLEWWQRVKAEGNEYYLTVPYSAKNGKITLNFTAADNIYIDGREYKSGDEIDIKTIGKSTVSANGADYSFEVLYTSDIPALHIMTDSGTLETEDREVKQSGYMALFDGGGLAYSGKLEHIKGRGNHSWAYDKKGFSIKLEKSFPVLGMDSSTNWALVASYDDSMLLRNHAAYKLADEADINFAVECHPVDLFINGQYWGNYQLTEKIEIANGRVEITDLGDETEKVNIDIPPETMTLGGVYEWESGYVSDSRKWINLPNNPANITGGYLLELQLAGRYDKTLGGFVTKYNFPLTIREPKMPTQQEVDYIADYFQQFEDAIMSDTGYNEQGRHYSDYIDVASFAKFYIFQEYTKNLDGSITSFYLYKERDGKICAGPVWDFDMSLGNRPEREVEKLTNPEGVWIYDTGFFEPEFADKKALLSWLCKHDDFMQRAAEQWNLYMEGCSEYMMPFIDEEYGKIKESVAVDKFRWEKDVRDKSLAEVEIWQQSEVEYLKNFMAKREIFMTEFLNGYKGNAN